MNLPKLACCNFISDVGALGAFAQKHDFEGIEWSLTPENLPKNPAQESALVASIAGLNPLEVRYHCAFPKTDLGDVDPEKARYALEVLRRVCRVISKLGGRFLTIHVGLGRDSTVRLSWDKTVERLAQLVGFANGLGVRVCLENLAWGWTSRPELYEKLIRKSGCRATLDIGHARVSPSVVSQQFVLEDFVSPHPESFLSAHVYHEEDALGHSAPARVEDIKERLQLLMRLPRCDWWVLEVREKEGLLETLSVVREFLLAERDEGLTASPSP
jgi:hypothetical protein